MCGICGIAPGPGSNFREDLRAMLSAMGHRGPDDEGVWAAPDSSVAFGHRRLSVLDLSEAGHQPMVSGDRRHVLVLNGEIYNHLELRRKLEQERGIVGWRGHSDTETLLACISCWGMERTLAAANGMFALALWDSHARELTLARDRLGEKPLYFGWLEGRLAFASELKALARLSSCALQVDPDAAMGFFALGYVIGDQSALSGIYRLPPGAALTLARDDLHSMRDVAWVRRRTRRWWSLHSVASAGMRDPSPRDATELGIQLEELLSESIRLRLLADVPVGAFLSGGIDSSLVVALMQAQVTSPVRTFSIGFRERGWDEAPHARAIARHLGTDHTELYVSSHDALELLPHLAHGFDEPFADTSTIPTWLVCRMARQQVTVALSGDGADELFAGYGRYQAILRLHRLLSTLPGRAVPTVAALLRATSSLLGAGDRAARGQAAARLVRLADRVQGGSLQSLRTSFIGGGARLTGSRSIGTGSCALPEAVQDALRQLMYLDQCEYLPDDILHKVDRASMAHGLEARVPMLDHRLVEWSWTLPRSMLVDGSRGKRLVRKVLERHVPASLFDRPKQGFAPPIGEWLRGPLRAWAESLLSEGTLMDIPILDAESVRSLWQSHLVGRRDAGIELWKVLSFAAWQRSLGATF